MLIFIIYLITNFLKNIFFTAEVHSNSEYEYSDSTPLPDYDYNATFDYSFYSMFFLNLLLVQLSLWIYCFIFVNFDHFFYMYTFTSVHRMPYFYTALVCLGNSSTEDLENFLMEKESEDETGLNSVTSPESPLSTVASKVQKSFTHFYNLS